MHADPPCSCMPICHAFMFLIWHTTFAQPHICIHPSCIPQHLHSFPTFTHDRQLMLTQFLTCIDSSLHLTTCTDSWLESCLFIFDSSRLILIHVSSLLLITTHLLTQDLFLEERPCTSYPMTMMFYSYITSLTQCDSYWYTSTHIHHVSSISVWYHLWFTKL